MMLVSEDATNLLKTALALPAEEREEFAAALWDSLDAETGLADHTDSELLAETQSRRNEIRSGEVQTIGHEELKSELGR